MKLTTKHYKSLKIKKIFKESPYILLGNNLIPPKTINSAQKFNSLNCRSYNIYNSIARKLLKKSIYSNFNFLISGLSILIEPNNLFKLKNLNEVLIIFAIKINNKIYHKAQLLNTTSFDTIKNFNNLAKTLKSSLKLINSLNYIGS